MKVKKIQQCIKNYLYRLNRLPLINIYKIPITYKSINVFNINSRNTNDINNKTREIIICAIINNTIPDCYYQYSNRWLYLRNNIHNWCKKLYTDKIEKIVCCHKGGRGYNYDFEININNTNTYNVELKFNTNKIENAPQFVSPMNPSHYMSASYEEYYYDNYLHKIALIGGLIGPTKQVYLSQIHSNSPPCMALFQEKYYKGCKNSSQYTGNADDILFYQMAKKLSNESIHTFITMNELNINSLNSYLFHSQYNKYYMLYKMNTFYLETVNTDQYKIISYEKQPNKYRFIATTQTGNKIKILLRWKNGNGIAFPAFQIS
jgi:hypothetical protein